MFSQSWCAPNSTWDYGWSSSASGTHVKLTYLYDTIINSNNCNKILYDETNCGIGWTAANSQYLYTYQQNGILFIKRNFVNQFDTLFYFTGTIGSKWRRNPGPNVNCSLSYAEIIDTGRIVIQGKTIKWHEIFYENHYIDFQSSTIIESGIDTIFERIGMKNGLNFILGNHCTTESDMLRLRCFSDIDISTTFLDETCNYCGTDVGIAESTKNETLKIFPIPVESILTIGNEEIHSDKSYILILNSIGQTIQKLSYQKNIDVSMFTTGFYFLKIVSGNRTLYTKFLKL